MNIIAPVDELIGELLSFLPIKSSKFNPNLGPYFDAILMRSELKTKQFPYNS